MSDERELLDALLKNYTVTLGLLEAVVKSSRNVVVGIQEFLEKEGEADEGTA